MASRHFSLQMSEVGDVLDLLYSYEQLNGVRLKVAVEVVRLPRGPELAIAVVAWGAEPSGLALPPLVSVSVRCLAINLRGILGALTHALYLVDSRLAQLELDGGKRPSA